MLESCSSRIRQMSSQGVEKREAVGHSVLVTVNRKVAHIIDGDPVGNLKKVDIH